ncbi:GntR family transcriptional regulator [Actinosynnema sp. NPDC059335]|uniref:GntR family transcriptional regulator n=1 Tax=Actinosynnema sp. NPDC059335 TaxID=3346804 RepID=UPI00366A8AC0
MAEPFTTKSDFAYTTLRQKILSGEFAPGQVLNQATLARTIGISTTPLREGLRRLKSEGLVELDAHRDARVTELTAAEARDLLEVRASLDPLAASLAALRRTESDLRALRAALRGLEPLRRDPRTADLAAHRRFHAALYRASHNNLLIATLEGLWDKADRYRRLALADGREDEEAELKAAEHRQLVEHVAAGDADAAADVMRRHVSTSLGAKAAARLGAT